MLLRPGRGRQGWVRQGSRICLTGRSERSLFSTHMYLSIVGEQASVALHVRDGNTGRGGGCLMVAYVSSAFRYLGVRRNLARGGFVDHAWRGGSFMPPALHAFSSLQAIVTHTSFFCLLGPHVFGMIDQNMLAARGSFAAGVADKRLRVLFCCDSCGSELSLAGSLHAIRLLGCWGFRACMRVGHRVAISMGSGQSNSKFLRQKCRYQLGYVVRMTYNTKGGGKKSAAINVYTPGF